MTQNIALPGVGENSPTRISSAIRQLAERLGDYGPLESPVFVGDPQAPTPPAADNDTSIATTAFVQTELTTYAPKASPVFTGNPTAPTPSPGDNDTSLATTAFVTAAVTAGAYAPPAVATGTIQSNVSGGSAAPSANTISSVLDNLLGATRGTVAYRGASSWAALTPGTSGQFLKTNGAGADPAWADVLQPPWTYIFKTSAQAITSSTTLVNDNELQVPVVSGQTIIFRVVYFLVAGGSHQAAINGPTASSIRVTTNTLGATGSTAAYNSAFASSSAIASPQTIEAIGKVVFTASGTFALRIAQAVSNATATTWEAGSYLEYRLI